MDKYQIHKAALEFDYEYAVKLIESKVNLDELDLDGHTPLHWAVFRGDVDFVKLLLVFSSSSFLIFSKSVI